MLSMWGAGGGEKTTFCYERTELHSSAYARLVGLVTPTRRIVGQNVGFQSQVKACLHTQC